MIEPGQTVLAGRALHWWQRLITFTFSRIRVNDQIARKDTLIWARVVGIMSVFISLVLDKFISLISHFGCLFVDKTYLQSLNVIVY